jgi:serine/threonine protein phosphatase PrpC
MGNLLGAPVTDKDTHTGVTSEGIKYGVSTMQGWRVHMEDAHITETRMYALEKLTVDGVTKENEIDLPGHGMFAVFDGHGGTYAAFYAGRNMCRVLSCQPKFVEYAKFIKERPEKEKNMTAPERAQYVRQGLDLLEGALCDAFVEIDREIACALKGTKVADADKPYNDDVQDHSEEARQKNEDMEGISQTDSRASPTDSALQLLEEEGDSGTTACVVLLTPEWVVCANAGDSRAVISRLGNKAVPLSYDHKPDDVEEQRRIRAAGGYVAGGRVEGDLAVSRGLGDFRFKNLDVVMAGVVPTQADNGSSENENDRPMFTPGDQKVSPIPDIIVQNRNPSQDEFVIVACDGIWDVQTNYEAVKMVAEIFEEGESDLGLLTEEVRTRTRDIGFIRISS